MFCASGSSKVGGERYRTLELTCRTPIKFEQLLVQPLSHRENQSPCYKRSINPPLEWLARNNAAAQITTNNGVQLEAEI